MSELKVDILQEVANSGAFSINTMDLTHTPMWYARLGSNQTVTRNTVTTVASFTGGSTITEPSTCFDGTTFTVPESDTVSYAGSYFIFAQTQTEFSSIGNDGENAFMAIHKNGSEIAKQKFSVVDEKHFQNVPLHLECINTLVAGDTITVVVQNADNNGGNAFIQQTGTNFGGFRLTKV